MHVFPARHILAIFPANNFNFYSNSLFLPQALSENPLADLVDASNDYLQYAKDLEERYLRRYGEVFTFGSGECGQVGREAGS